MIKRTRVLITGRVQGVGFRPAVYRMARAMGLAGFACNDTKGVTIELQGEQRKIDEFLARLQSSPDKPPLAAIRSCNTSDIAVIDGQEDFAIRESDSQGPVFSQVTADIAACEVCLAEMADQRDFRHAYPFINCTNCGPRYSIVRTIPYDRPNTTMSAFKMCSRCAGQYADVSDRRFHAQPIACPACGPKLWLADSNGQTIQAQSDLAVAEAARLLSAGKIVAIKGIGGFHLAVDALNNAAVERLRERKRRDHKPFAMMTNSIDKVRHFAIVGKTAEHLLTSPQSPIVLLPKKDDAAIAPSVAPGVNTFGFMLCYAPLHYLLFAHNLKVLVMTSGNISDEPLICENRHAIEKLGCIADAFLMHDREICRQVDDSIVYLVQEQPVLLRRARGYVPTPLITEQSCKQDILAAGSDLKNTFCLVKQNQLICSEHIGDLEDAEVYHHYIDAINHLQQLFEVEPNIVACDLHPGYLSTQYACSLAGVRVIRIQHHWAHIASVLAEHDQCGPVIGIGCDGTGYGTDGAIWGCECMIASVEKFKRFGHLAYYRLAGADAAGKEAVRPLLGLLRRTYGSSFRPDRFRWLLDRIEPDANRVQILCEQLEKQVNCVETSSLGRVFDAVAAMLSLGTCNHFDAQLPMALESIADNDTEDRYSFEIVRSEPLQLDLSGMMIELIADVRKGLARGVVAAKFHNCLAAGLLETAKAARESTKLNTVAISGGVFCNRYLAERLIALLQDSSFDVLFNREVPSNDAGLSLGQAVIASRIAAQIPQPFEETCVSQMSDVRDPE